MNMFNKALYCLLKGIIKRNQDHELPISAMHHNIFKGCIFFDNESLRHI